MQTLGQANAAAKQPAESLPIEDIGIESPQAIESPPDVAKEEMPSAIELIDETSPDEPQDPDSQA